MTGDEGTDPGVDADDELLGDLAREARERRRGDRDGGDVDWDGLFESVETPEVDAESVWDALSDDAEDPAVARGVGVGSDPEAVEATGARGVREHVVPKRAYCQQCPHFSDPPAVACDHDGTAIVEVVDADRFRVRNCPVARDVAGGRDADAE